MNRQVADCFRAGDSKTQERPVHRKLEGIFEGNAALSAVHHTFYGKSARYTLRYNILNQKGAYLLSDQGSRLTINHLLKDNINDSL